MVNNIPNASNNPWSFNEELDTTKSFPVFTAFRDMGDQRSLPKVAKQMGKNLSLVQRWSSEGKWIERCHKYDLYVDETKVDRALKINIDSHTEKLRRYRIQHENLGWQAFEVANKCLEISRKALQRYCDDPSIELRPVDIKMISSAGVSSSEIGSKLLSEALAVERLLEMLPIDVQAEEVQQAEE